MCVCSEPLKKGCTPATKTFVAFGLIAKCTGFNSCRQDCDVLKGGVAESVVCSVIGDEWRVELIDGVSC